MDSWRKTEDQMKKQEKRWRQYMKQTELDTCQHLEGMEPEGYRNRG
jgi:ribosomal protein L32E